MDIIEKIRKIIFEKPKHFTKIIKNNSEYRNYIDFYPGDTIYEKCWYFYHNKTPRDLECVNGNRKKISKIHSMEIFCKKHCACDVENCNTKRKATSLSRYGVENPQQNKQIKTKTLQTNISKYGVENPQQNKQIKTKTLQTNISKYGVTVAANSTQMQKEIRNRYLSVHGVDHPLKNPLIRERIKTTNLLKYGTPHHNQKNYSKETKMLLFDRDLLVNFVESKTIKHASVELEVSESNLLKILKKYNIENYERKQNNQEIELERVLKDWLINFERNNRKILDGMELDFYLPDYKVAIELNGLYWHSDLFKDKNYHPNKTKICNNQGIQLIHIFEDEWMNKREIVLNRLKNKLGLLKPTPARKCQIKEISHRESRLFENNNHIQGSAVASVRIGLFFENRLVQIMTFSKSRFDKKYEWELVRLCSTQPVIGGANKLFKYFVKTRNPESVISYCDLRWNIGKIYERLGFIKTKTTVPGYEYFYNGTRTNRISLQNHKLTLEQKQMRDLSPKIYNCGNSVWEWKCL